MLDMIQALDEAAQLWIQEWLRCPVLDTFFSAFTQLGNAGLVWLVVSGGMLLFPKARRAGFWALVAMLFGLLCTNIVLKHLVGRVRPWLVVEGLTRLVAEHDPNSFPSGHTCAAFAAGATWARYAKKRWLKGLCIAQAVLMGFSRLYVGVHFPSDVLAGCAVGLSCAWLSLQGSQWVDRKREERSQ